MSLICGNSLTQNRRNSTRKKKKNVCQQLLFFYFVSAAVGQLIVALGVSLVGGENYFCGDDAVIVACGGVRGALGQNQVLVKDRELP